MSYPPSPATNKTSFCLTGFLSSTLTVACVPSDSWDAVSHDHVSSITGPPIILLGHCVLSSFQQHSLRLYWILTLVCVSVYMHVHVCANTIYVCASGDQDYHRWCCSGVIQLISKHPRPYQIGRAD